MKRDEWHALHEERHRTYLFSDGSRLSFDAVASLKVSSSGTHYLTLKDCQKVIVPTGWRALFIDADTWSA